MPRPRSSRSKNWIAAHIRERRYELDLTQQEVAERAETSVLDKELLIGIERQVPDEEPEREVAPAPKLAAA